jgi:hypothetical protein
MQNDEKLRLFTLCSSLQKSTQKQNQSKKNPKQPNIATQIKDQRKPTFKGFFFLKPSEPSTYYLDQR